MLLSLQRTYGKEYKTSELILTFIWPLSYLLFFINFNTNEILINIERAGYLWRVLLVFILIAIEYKFFIKKSNLYISTRIAILTSLLWFGSSMVYLYTWAFSSSFGNMAQETGYASTFYIDLHRAFVSICGPVLFFIFPCLFAIFISGLIIRTNWNPDQTYLSFIKSKLPPLAVIAGGTIPFILLFFYSNTRDLRYFHIFSLILYFTLITIFFMEPFLRKPKLLIIANLMMIFPVYAHINYSKNNKIPWLLKGINRSIPYRYLIIKNKSQVNPTENILNKLSEILNKSGYGTNAQVTVLSLNPFSAPGLVINHTSLLVKQHEMGLPFKVWSPLRINLEVDKETSQQRLKIKNFLSMLKDLPNELHKHSYTNIISRLDYIKRHSTHILLAPINFPCTKKEGYSKCGMGHYKNLDLADWLVEIDKMNLLQKFGIKRVKSFSYYDYYGNFHDSVLLVFSNKNEPQS